MKTLFISSFILLFLFIGKANASLSEAKSYIKQAIESADQANSYSKQASESENLEDAKAYAKKAMDAADNVKLDLNLANDSIDQAIQKLDATEEYAEMIRRNPDLLDARPYLDDIMLSISTAKSPLIGGHQ
jgi:F0F1-type ATP synthase membrane subunit b/b'